MRRRALDTRSGKRVSRESILVQPERSVVSPFCAQLTTLSPDEVAHGVPFARACAILRRKYSGPRRMWASYGDDDRRMFERQCQARGVPHPLSAQHINIKSLFALLHGLDYGRLRPRWRWRACRSKGRTIAAWMTRGTRPSAGEPADPLAAALAEAHLPGNTVAAREMARK